MRARREISVHKGVKAAQLIPSFLHNGDDDGAHADFRWHEVAPGSVDLKAREGLNQHGFYISRASIAL
jgi:hypothetical protein